MTIIKGDNKAWTTSNFSKLTEVWCPTFFARNSTLMSEWIGHREHILVVVGHHVLISTYRCILWYKQYRLCVRDLTSLTTFPRWIFRNPYRRGSSAVDGNNVFVGLAVLFVVCRSIFDVESKVDFNYWSGSSDACGDLLPSPSYQLHLILLTKTGFCKMYLFRLFVSLL
jgi:hypothetical protein